MSNIATVSSEIAIALSNIATVSSEIAIASTDNAIVSPCKNYKSAIAYPTYRPQAGSLVITHISEKLIESGFEGLN